jgi:hypothetical protein
MINQSTKCDASLWSNVTEPHIVPREPFLQCNDTATRPGQSPYVKRNDMFLEKQEKENGRLEHFLIVAGNL